MKRRKFIFYNRWKQTTAYRITFFPELTDVKQRKYKSVGIEIFGFCFTLETKKQPKNIPSEGQSNKSNKE